MNACYIIYSPAHDRFYVGATHESVNTRVQNHNNKKYGASATSFTNDWEIFLIIECQSFSMALHIEKHIKKMKSKTYIQNLLKYPQLVSQIKLKFSI